MGNEMGNRNVSGLQEEDSTTVERPEKTSHVDEVKGENQKVLIDEAKDYHSKVIGLASNDPSKAGDPPVDNHTEVTIEKVENEVQPVAESPNVQVESNDASAEDSGVQPVAEYPVESNDGSAEDNGVQPVAESPNAQVESSDAGAEDSGVQPVAESPNDQVESNDGSIEASGVQPVAESLNAQVESSDAGTEDSGVQHVAESPNDQVESNDGSIEASGVQPVAESLNAQVESSDAGAEDSGVQPAAEYPNVQIESSDAGAEDSGVQPVAEYPNVQIESSDAGAEDSGVQPVAESPNVQVEPSDAGAEDGGVQHVAESPNVRIESNDGSAEDNGVQPASLSSDVSHHKKPQDSNLEGNLSGLSDHERETATEEEGTRNSTIDTKSATHESEPLESVDPKSDQHVLATIHTNPSIEDHSGSLRGIEEILGLKLTCDSEEKYHSSDSEIPRIVAESVVSNTNLDAEKKKDEDHLSDSEISQIVAESVVSNTNLDAEKENDDFLITELASQEEKALDRSFYEEKMEIKYGDEAGNGMSKLTREMSNFLSESGNKRDEKIPMEMNVNDSLDPQAEAILVNNLLQCCDEVVAEPNDKCMVLTEETKLIKNGTEENLHEYNQTRFPEELINACQSEFKITEFRNESEENRSPIKSSCNSGINEDSEIDMAEKGYKVETFPTNTYLDSNKHRVAEEERAMVSENGKVITQLTVTDSNSEAESSIDKKSIEEVEMKNQDEYAIGNSNEGREAFSTEPTEGWLSPSPLFSIHSQDHKQDNVASAVVLHNEQHRQDSLQFTEKIPLIVVAETSKFTSGGYEVVGGLSTESNPENLEIPVQIRKSPSFNFDFLNEARRDESDQTPLLYKDKTANAGSLSNPVAETELSVEERAIKLKTSDSEKLRTPFLSLMKEEEETHIMVTEQKKNATDELWKEVESTSPLKTKEKRRSRSSLFSNCICCAAYIN